MKVSTYTYTIGAGKSKKIASRGRFVRGMASELPYELRLDDSAPSKFQTGVAFQSPEFFSEVELINTASVEQTIEIIISDGVVDDARLVGQIDISGGIRFAGNTAAGYGAIDVTTAATLVRPDNSKRASVVIQNTGASKIYVGSDAAVTTANGLQIDPGGMVSITTQSAVYAVSETGTNNVRWLEENV